MKADSDTGSTAESALVDSIIRDKSDVTVKIPLNEEDEKKMKDILSNPANRKFLLDTLGKKRRSDKGSSKVRISPTNFAILQEFLMGIFKGNCF